MLELTQSTSTPSHHNYRSPRPLPSSFFTVPLLLSGGCVSTGAPENSLPALEDARTKYGAGLALDIRATSDKRLVVFRDASLRRLLGDKRLLADVSYRELMSLSFRDTGLKVLALEDVFEEFGGLPLFLDLREPGLELGLAKLLKAFPYSYESLLINSWWNSGMEALREEAPQVAHSRSVSRTENPNWLRRVLSSSQRSGKEPCWTRSRSPIVALDSSVFSHSDVRELKSLGVEVLLRDAPLHEAEMLRSKLGVVPISSESLLLGSDTEESPTSCFLM